MLAFKESTTSKHINDLIVWFIITNTGTKC